MDKVTHYLKDMPFYMTLSDTPVTLVHTQQPMEADGRLAMTGLVQEND